jgi:hypothetical protein
MRDHPCDAGEIDLRLTFQHSIGSRAYKAVARSARLPSDTYFWRCSAQTWGKSKDGSKPVDAADRPAIDLGGNHDIEG